MHDDVLVFLLSLATLLASARLLGELARAAGLPLVVGEIGAGILLGPTALGRTWPTAEAWLFPRGGAPEQMLAAYETLAVVLLLVVAGLDVDLRVVRKRGRSALLTSVLGLLLPLAGGVLFGLMLPDRDLPDPSRRLVFAAFMGVALSISALPVIAKTLLDLGLFKTDIGLLVMTAAMVDDLAGWLGFSVLVGPIRGAGFEWTALLWTVSLTVAFVAACWFIARPLIDRLFVRLEAQPHTAPGRVLSVVLVFALFAAAATEKIGIHAVFGGFIVGVTVGATPRLTERTRVAIEDFVMNVFAPLFFATLGLRADFVGAFDLRLCVLVFVIASVAKIVGCTLGARGGGLRWREAAAVGVGLNARGAMEIVLAVLARKAGLITDPIFVALVVMALATSLIAGPLMKTLLYRGDRDEEEDVVALLRRGAFVSELHAHTPKEAITELVRALGSLLTGFKRDARDLVIERELVASTGLGDEVAIPHAAIEGLDRPLLALGRAPAGIDFDAPDGKPARIVFLLLIPPKAYEAEVRILASIARAIYDQRARKELLEAKEFEDVVRVLSTSARRVKESQRPPPPVRIGEI